MFAHSSCYIFYMFKKSAWNIWPLWYFLCLCIGNQNNLLTTLVAVLSVSLYRKSTPNNWPLWWLCCLCLCKGNRHKLFDPLIAVFSMSLCRKSARIFTILVRIFSFLCIGNQCQLFDHSSCSTVCVLYRKSIWSTHTDGKSQDECSSFISKLDQQRASQGRIGTKQGHRGEYRQKRDKNGGERHGQKNLYLEILSTEWDTGGTGTKERHGQRRRTEENGAKGRIWTRRDILGTETGTIRHRMNAQALCRNWMNRERDRGE